MVFLPFTKSSQKNRVGEKIKTAFRVVSVKNLQQLRKFWKDSPVFPVGLIQTESCSISSKPSLIPVADFRSLFSLNGTPFAPVENAIPRRNLSVLNFSYHLPKPLIDRFDHVNDN